MRFDNSKAQLFIMASALQCLATRAFSRVSSGGARVRLVRGANAMNEANFLKCYNAARLLSTVPDSTRTTTELNVKSADETLDELDAALENILSGVTEADAKASSKSDGKKAKVVVKKSVPSNFVEEEGFDYQDPEFRSTSNPHWVEAGLSQEVIDVLSAKGITRLTPVQAEAFAPVLAGRDVIGRSRTGTGKTLALGLPSIERIVKLSEEKGLVNSAGRRKPNRPPSMIVLCPTRELARQVQEELAEVSKPYGLHSAVFHGGVSYDPQRRDLRRGLDILVGTPGRIIDHLDNGHLDLSYCDVAVLDEADEMLNMGFADDVERILDGVGSSNDQKTQCLLFSATTPSWVKEIGRNYQDDVLMIDSTSKASGARTATTVRHLALQIPPGPNMKSQILEDVIAVEISKDIKVNSKPDEDENEIAAAARAKKEKSQGAMQQKIFGKTIVFTQTKRDADELVSGGVFKSLTAQALHGDVGQKQRDATLNAFRAGAFNVLVATDVAARGIDIQDVDLVIQYEPPRDVDTYVHRSGRTGRAERNGTSVVLFDYRQQRDIVKIERELGHGFKFELTGPPSVQAALNAAAKTSAVACKSVPEETSEFFKESAAELLADGEDPVDIVARCLAAISRRSAGVESRSLLTGESGVVTLEMSNDDSRPVSAGDVMFTVSKLARQNRKDGEEHEWFDSDVGKIQSNFEKGTAMFDMSVQDAKNLVAYSGKVENDGVVFSILEEIGIRDRKSVV